MKGEMKLLKELYLKEEMKQSEKRDHKVQKGMFSRIEITEYPRYRKEIMKEEPDFLQFKSEKMQSEIRKEAATLRLKEDKQKFSKEEKRLL